MTIIHKTDINKFFRIEDKFYRIFKVTKHNIYYAECFRDHFINLRNSIMCEEQKFITYSHFLSDTFYGNIISKLKTEVNTNMIYDNISDMFIVSFNVEGDNTNSSVFENYENSIFKTGCNFFMTTHKLTLAYNTKVVLLSLFDIEPNTNFFKKEFIDKYIKMSKFFLEKIDLEFIIDNICSEMEEYYINEIVTKFKLILNVIQHNDKECPICLENKTLCEGYFECTHSICSDCNDSLNKRICPMCRSE